MMNFRVMNFREYQDLDAVKALGDPPVLVEVYHAYKGGQGKTFTTKQGALATNPEHISRAYDPESKKKHDQYWDAMRDIESKSIEAWHQDLRKEHANFNEKVYALIYDEAYDRGHSSGYDSVADYMRSLASFAEDIIKASKA